MTLIGCVGRGLRTGATREPRCRRAEQRPQESSLHGFLLARCGRSSCRRVTRTMCAPDVRIKRNSRWLHGQSPISALQCGRRGGMRKWGPCTEEDCTVRLGIPAPLAPVLRAARPPELFTQELRT